LLTAVQANADSLRDRGRDTVGGELARGEAASEVCTAPLVLDGEITARGIDCIKQPYGRTNWFRDRTSA